MLSQLFDYVRQLLFLVRDAQQNREDVEELRRELQQTNSLLIDLANKVERLSERERLEREKFELKVENGLLRFERLLPPTKESRKQK